MKTTSMYPLVLIIVLLTLFNPQQTKAQNNKFVVVLDAGHGGHDPGNLGNGYKEKDISLNVILKIGKTLEAYKDIKVIYTRKTDVFLKLRERAAIANRADADLFVSVHCNSHNSQAKGTETFVLGVANTKRNFEIAKKENEVIFLEKGYKENYNGFDPSKPESLIGLKLVQEEYVDQSILLASLIEKNFVNESKRSSRGIKQASLWVMHNTYMPSVLVELGFLTNNYEGKFLNTKAGQTKMASSISKAITVYMSSLGYSNTDEPGITNSKGSGRSELNLESNLNYKVQIAASKNNLAAKSYNFKGLTSISKEKTGSIYRYFYGETSSLSEIERLKSIAVKKGYTTAYIVTYKNGKRVK